MKLSTPIWIYAAWACCILASIPGCGVKKEKYVNGKIQGAKFRLEVMVTPEEITRGMGGRTSLGKNEGMLFAFPRMEHRRFWMKDCLIPLDIIFVDGLGYVVSIHTLQPPKKDAKESEIEACRSGGRALITIELAAGRAKELGLKVGSKIEIPIKQLKAMAEAVEKENKR